MSKVTCLVITIMTLQAVYCQLGGVTSSLKHKPKSKEDCGSAKCKSPPKEGGDVECKVVPPEDKSVPRPTGKNANCCPLWKCKSKSDPNSYYTYHGYEGGSETVHYKRNKNGGMEVDSEADGDHDSTASASSGGGGGNIDVGNLAMQEISKAFKQLHFNFG